MLIEYHAKTTIYLPNPTSQDFHLFPSEIFIVVGFIFWALLSLLPPAEHWPSFSLAIDIIL